MNKSCPILSFLVTLKRSPKVYLLNWLLRWFNSEKAQTIQRVQKQKRKINGPQMRYIARWRRKFSVSMSEPSRKTVSKVLKLLICIMHNAQVTQHSTVNNWTAEDRQPSCYAPAAASVYYVHKIKPDNFSIILVMTGEFFKIKFGGLILSPSSSASSSSRSER